MGSLAYVQDRRRRPVPLPIDDEECDTGPALGMGDGEAADALAQAESRGNEAIADSLGLRSRALEGPAMRRTLPAGARVLRLDVDADEVMSEVEALFAEAGQTKVPDAIRRPLIAALHSVDVWTRSPYWSTSSKGDGVSECLWPGGEAYTIEIESAVEGETILSEGERDGVPTQTTEGDWVLEARLTVINSCGRSETERSIPTAGRIVVEDLMVRR